MIGLKSEILLVALARKTKTIAKPNVQNMVSFNSDQSQKPNLNKPNTMVATYPRKSKNVIRIDFAKNTIKILPIDFLIDLLNNIAIVAMKIQIKRAISLFEKIVRNLVIYFRLFVFHFFVAEKTEA